MITYSTPIIFENDADRELLIRTLEGQRTAFNICSEIQFKLPKNSIVDLHSKAYRKIRDLHPEIPSKLVVQAQRECLSKYKTITKNKHKITTPINKTKISCVYTKQTCRINTNKISITVIGKRINVKYHKYPKLTELLKKYPIGDPSIFVKDEIVYFAFIFKTPEPIINEEQAIGVDLGIRRLATTSEGVIFQDRAFLAKKRKLRHLKSCLKSKGTRSAKRHLKKLRHKERNINRNFNHHLSKQIILSTKANVIVLEDLRKMKTSIKAKKKFKNMNRISQVGFYQLRQFITYKAPLFGKRVETVCPSYTSQIDHSTGLHYGERKGCRFYGARNKVYDADVNAAINIGKRSQLPISCARVLNGQAFVSTPIVGLIPSI